VLAHISVSCAAVALSKYILFGRHPYITTGCPVCCYWSSIRTKSWTFCTHCNYTLCKSLQRFLTYGRTNRTNPTDAPQLCVQCHSCDKHAPPSHLHIYTAPRVSLLSQAMPVAAAHSNLSEQARLVRQQRPSDDRRFNRSDDIFIGMNH